MRPKRHLAFSLLELMIVVGIMGLIATLGVPIVYRIWHQEPLRKAVKDIFEVCSYARKQAILKNEMTELVLHPRDGRLEVIGGASAKPADADFANAGGTTTTISGDGSSAQLSEDVIVEDLDINKVPGGFKDAEAAYVRFFPNGSCDEMSLVIRYENTWRQIKLEVSTGLPTIEVDPHNFK